ncbi:cation transporter [Nitrincola iocasae]|uniref:cation transporter n=1 Tax=Nitrincola iocasae TaxID=2614693 RepID=UPI001CD923EB|nr:cation transporter [Nitrincola iocasae]
MVEHKLKLDGLTCGGCVKVVKQALEQLDGIESFEVTQDSAIINGSVDLDTLIETIENAGFEATAA